MKIMIECEGKNLELAYDVKHVALTLDNGDVFNLSGYSRNTIWIECCRDLSVEQPSAKLIAVSS